MYRFIFISALLIFTVCSGCFTTVETPEELGLKSKAELDAYFMIPKNQSVSDKYVTHFAKSNLKQGNTIVIGAVSSINYDIPNAQRGTIEIFQNLWGIHLKKLVNVYSSEIGFLEACSGEQVFVLKAFANGTNAKIITNFQLDPQIREHQIRLLLELLKLESIDNFLLRKKELVEKCFEHLDDEIIWVANTWTFQLYYFCKDYPDYLSFEDLMKLKKYEREYVLNRPHASDVLKIIKATIIETLRLKFKRVWFEKIMYGSEQEALKAIGLIDVWVSSSYKNAFTFEDRVVVNSLINLTDSPQVMEELIILEQHLRDILTTF